MLLNYSFKSAERAIVFEFDGAAAIVQQGALQVDFSGQAVVSRGWFRTDKHLPDGTKGTLILAADVRFTDLIVVISSGEFCLWRHEFTSDPREADPEWRPAESVAWEAQPVDLDELKRLLGRGLRGGAGQAVVFDGQGGWRKQ